MLLRWLVARLRQQMSKVITRWRKFKENIFDSTALTNFRFNFQYFNENWKRSVKLIFDQKARSFLTKPCKNEKYEKHISKPATNTCKESAAWWVQAFELLKIQTFLISKKSFSKKLFCRSQNFNNLRQHQTFIHTRAKRRNQM